MGEASKLQAYLRSVALGAEEGDRLPTVRKLMRDFSLSQQVVQRAINDLKTEGLIDAHVGRGTFFTKNKRAEGGEFVPSPSSNKHDNAPRSVIMLRRSSSNLRGRVVLESLQHRLNSDGHVTLEVGYSDPEHAKQVLHTLPRFDACIVQNSFDIMPVEMISAIRRKTDTIIVDGAWLVGTDIDAVGFEWGQSVESAVRRLVTSGHDCIHYVTTASFFLANEMGLHRWRNLRDTAELADVIRPELKIAKLPAKDYEEAVVAALVSAMSESHNYRAPAVVVWGVEDGARFKSLLEQEGLALPADLSVILLGRTDLDSETGGFFQMIGYTTADQVDGLYDRLIERWQKRKEPYGLRLLAMREREGLSVGTHRSRD
jgi:DNA-binding LacI/PurR family transcriptional regulator